MTQMGAGPGASGCRAGRQASDLRSLATPQRPPLRAAASEAQGRPPSQPPPNPFLPSAPPPPPWAGPLSRRRMKGAARPRPGRAARAPPRKETRASMCARPPLSDPSLPALIPLPAFVWPPRRHASLQAAAPPPLKFAAPCPDAPPFTSLRGRSEACTSLPRPAFPVRWGPPPSRAGAAFQRRPSPRRGWAGSTRSMTSTTRAAPWQKAAACLRPPPPVHVPCNPPAAGFQRVQATVPRPSTAEPLALLFPGHSRPYSNNLKAAQLTPRPRPRPTRSVRTIF